MDKKLAAMPGQMFTEDKRSYAPGVSDAKENHLGKKRREKKEGRGKLFKPTVTREGSLVLNPKRIRVPSSVNEERPLMGKVVFNRSGKVARIGMDPCDRFSGGRHGVNIISKTGKIQQMYKVVLPSPTPVASNAKTPCRPTKPKTAPNLIIQGEAVTAWPGKFSSRETLLYCIDLGLRSAKKDGAFLELKVFLSQFGLRGIIGLIDPRSEVPLTEAQSFHICLFFKNGWVQLDPLCYDLLKEEIEEGKTDVLRNMFIKYETHPLTMDVFKVSMREETNLQEFAKEEVCFHASGDVVDRVAKFLQVFSRFWPTDKELRLNSHLDPTKIWPTDEEMAKVKEAIRIAENANTGPGFDSDL